MSFKKMVRGGGSGKKKYENDNNEYVMYVLVNNDLKMGKGKIASQCMHGACHVSRILERQGKAMGSTTYACYSQWIQNGETTIVLKSNEIDMQALINKYGIVKENIWCVSVFDQGRTQVENGSLTVICFKPIKRSDTPLELKKLNCL